MHKDKMEIKKYQILSLNMSRHNALFFENCVKNIVSIVLGIKFNAVLFPCIRIKWKWNGNHFCTKFIPRSKHSYFHFYIIIVTKVKIY